MATRELISREDLDAGRVDFAGVESDGAPAAGASGGGAPARLPRAARDVSARPGHGAAGAGRTA